MTDLSDARRGSRGLVVVMLAAVLLGVGACKSALESTRRHVYPPSFNYITDDQLQASMWQLAAGVNDLERILGNDRPISTRNRLDVIRTLDAMKSATDRLGPEGWPSNHKLITQNLARFREQLANARRAAEIDPPSFYLAGTIAGACLACH
jgi:hypothetical protein